MDKLRSFLLKNYEGRDFVTRMKARFFLYLSLVLVLALPVSGLYTAYINLHSHAMGYSLNMGVLIAEFVAFIIIITIIHQLYKGRFSLSAHLLVSSAFLVIWAVIFLDRSSAITRLDTIGFIIAFLGILPLAITRRKYVIIAYTSANIAALLLFFYFFRHQLEILDSAVAEFILDNTLSMAIVGTIAYAVFSINREALDRAEADIAARKSAEQDLSFSNALLKAQAEATIDGIVFVGNDKNIISCNRRFVELWDVPPGLLETGSAVQLVRQISAKLSDPEEFTRTVNRLFGTADESLLDETPLRDGRTFERRSEPVRGPDGAHLGRVWFFRDITEKKTAEKERKELEERLAQSRKMESIGRLAGGIAHDFNNLLTAISGNVQLALMDLDAGNSPRRLLEEADRAADRAAALTRQLLAFSRKQIIEPRVLDLNRLIGKMESLLTRLIGENIELKAISQQGLANIRADEGQLEQAIINLVVNARDAMPAGGRLTIETADVVLDEFYCRQHVGVIPGPYVLLAVSDTGEGMDDATLRRLFEPFFTTKPTGKGTGLGLATIYGAVTQNGGTIKVYSEPGRGTTFKLYFPAVDAETEERAVVASEDLPRGVETILLVEDEPQVRDFALSALSRLGYSVIPCAHAEDALERAGERPDTIDLLLTDVVLPGMNGRDLAAKITGLNPSVRVLYTSGYTGNVIVHHGVLEEGIQFIGKPYTINSLAAKVREVLDGETGTPPP